MAHYDLVGLVVVENLVKNRHITLRTRMTFRPLAPKSGQTLAPELTVKVTGPEGLRSVSVGCAELLMDSPWGESQACQR